MAPGPCPIHHFRHQSQCCWDYLQGNSLLKGFAHLFPLLIEWNSATFFKCIINCNFASAFTRFSATFQPSAFTPSTVLQTHLRKGLHSWGKCHYVLNLTTWTFIDSPAQFPFSLSTLWYSKDVCFDVLIRNSSPT